MSLLRIYAPLGESPSRCEWALVQPAGVTAGAGALAELPRGAKRIQLVLPAAEVLITRAKLPAGAKRRAASTLAFAVEEASCIDPELNHVSWLGDDAFAVVDKQGLRRWAQALAAAGLRGHEVQSETLLLPWRAGEWTLAWDGSDGFVRTGSLEGAATDGGDATVPPLALQLLVEEAGLRGERPKAIAVHATAADAPDLDAWQRVLAVPLRLAGPCDWRTAPAETGVALTQERRRWRESLSSLAKLRPAAWICALALGIHGAALVADWSALAGEQRALRARMEARFRLAFPDAVAVVDPVLQMRRQLAASRHRAGAVDGGDFPPMIDKVAAGLKDLPPGALRTLSYESGRVSLGLPGVDEAALSAVAARLARAELIVEASGGKRITVRSP